jgi:predicted double-glycine peptidase
MSLSGPDRRAVRGVSPALLMLLLAGCAAAPLSEGGGAIDATSTIAFRLPVTSLIGRRFDTVIRQRFDFSCGSAALATLLRYHYEDPQDEQSVFVGMFRDGDRAQIQRVGFSLLDMKRYLAARGVRSDGYRVTLPQIAAARVPGIALIDFNGYKHFVVIKGVERGALILGDPSLGLRREAVATFLKQWNGVFFVLVDPVGRSEGRFNQASDLARTPAGRFYSEAEPLSIAGLALTRAFVLPAPLPQEF